MEENGPVHTSQAVRPDEETKHLVRRLSVRSCTRKSVETRSVVPFQRRVMVVFHLTDVKNTGIGDLTTLRRTTRTS